MFKFLKQEISWVLVLFFLSLAVFVVYWATSTGTTPYDYFTRLANAFLHGKYYLDTNPSWLNELIPINNGEFAIVYPPAPALVSIPFVLVFGSQLEQQIVSQIMGAVAAFVWGVIAYRKSGKKLTSFWIFLVASLGSIVWFMSASGSVWYMGQISAYLFLTLTIYESLNKKRLPLLVLYFGLAILSRLQLTLAIPLIIYLNREGFKNLKRFFSFVLGLMFFGVIYGIYNYLRFGNFFETGYGLIPGVLTEPWYHKGIFDISYIPNHLRVLFASFPIFSNQFPFIKPSWGGLAIWITSPVFIYSLFTNIKDGKVQITWISLLLIALIVFSHGSTGFTQFGYRFAVDFYPLILFLLVEGISNTNLKWHHWLLLFFSMLVNLWGVLCINKFNLVGW
jgi:hypothetical protein